MLDVNVYHGLVQTIDELERSKRLSDLPAAYDRLLTEFPHLEGFWIRYAHTMFRLKRTPEAAVSVFTTALNTPVLDHSLLIWVAYLRFLLHVCYTAAKKPQSVHELFERAANLIGTHFLSHEFWDLYLEIHEQPVTLLLQILDNYTLHQFARYYARLVGLLDESVDLQPFKELLPLEVQNTAVSQEELPRVRAVVLSRMKLKYELHLRRVNAILPFELAVRRPFFYAAPYPPPDVPNWIKYIEGSSENPLPVFYRALIPCSLDAKMWLMYIRYWHSHGTADEITAAYRIPVKLKLVPVLLHYALWLEYQKDIEQANSVYKIANDVSPSETEKQYAQFTARTSAAS